MLLVEKIGKFFLPSQWIVRNISFEVEKGDFVLITGASGSGKTTLLHLISSLLTPSEGAVFFEDKNIYSLSEKELLQLRQNHFSFLFQNDYLIEELSVKENIFLPLEGKLKLEDYLFYEEKILNLVQKMELKDVLELFPRILSPGQRQRISFCRAILKEPTILFMDEPFSSLDYKNKEILSQIIDDYWKEGNTIIMVTHEENLIKGYTQKIKL